MKRFALLLLALCSLASAAAAQPAVLDLLGKWEGQVDVGKFTLKLVLRVAKAPGDKVEVTLDIPDQGQKGIGVAALLYNPPEVRIEMDQIGTSYNGKVNSTFDEITGEFEEGPGGRPVAVTFKRSKEPDAPEPVKVFTFAPGEPLDIRGYWKGAIEPFPGLNVTAALNIGRVPDGTFRATLDLLDQGAKDIPATSVTTSNKMAKMEWKGFQASFDGKLSDDGKTLSGIWEGRGRTNPVTFARLDAPATLLPKEIAYEPEKNNPEDVRGYWKGVLEVPMGKIRIHVKIGRTPDGSFAGTLASPDQGGRELPMSSSSIAPPKITMEWKGIRGKFDGKLNKEGNLMEGTWEQFGNPMPLKLERTSSFEEEKKS